MLIKSEHADWEKERDTNYYPGYPVVYYQRQRYAIVHPDYAEYLIEPLFVIVDINFEEGDYGSHSFRSH